MYKPKHRAPQESAIVNAARFILTTMAMMLAIAVGLFIVLYVFIQIVSN